MRGKRVKMLRKHGLVTPRRGPFKGRIMRPRKPGRLNGGLVDIPTQPTKEA